jgi:hypothetical protein
MLRNPPTILHVNGTFPRSLLDNLGIKVDRRFLKLHPDACGQQHDATEPGYFGGRVKWWTKTLRGIDPNAILHPSVYDRFAAEKVQHFYAMQPYRPKNLSRHEKLKRYYPQER